MKRLVIGLLAHVDSGKTTLAEGLLYRAGVLRKLGRVDHKDAFLDTDAQERARGINIPLLAAEFGQRAAVRQGHYRAVLHSLIGGVVVGRNCRVDIGNADVLAAPILELFFQQAH